MPKVMNQMETTRLADREVHNVTALLGRTLHARLDYEAAMAASQCCREGSGFQLGEATTTRTHTVDRDR